MTLGWWLTVAVAVAPVLTTHSSATTWSAQEIYSNNYCAGTPVVLKMIESASCDEKPCSVRDMGGYTLSVAVSCNIIDKFKYTAKRFDGSDYVIMEEYGQIGCQELVQTTVYPASGTCKKSSALANNSDIVSLYDNGSAIVLLFDNANCSNEPSKRFQLVQEEITNGDCIHDRYKFYAGLASKQPESSSSTVSYDSNLRNGVIADDGLSWGVIASIVGGVVACIAFMAFAIFRYIRFRRNDNLSKDTGIAALAASYAGFPTPESALNAITLGSEVASSQRSTNVEGKSRSRSGRSGMSGMSGMSRMSGLWDDEVIITARVPREKVLVQDLISRGGYGEVYSGMFNEEPVAVKMLLPEMRKSIRHMNAFLCEVKLMASLSHERIVRFIGVAWDSLTDLCVLSEYMEGGDLRTLLKSYEENSTPTGFDRKKTTIALHVAHALTYLHSLSPPILHRDLKSRNILLTSKLDAKLTDFGISRERSDSTMTGGVGSSRWMAPEVMMGERYDDKADMFSFGVVLSELDQHLLPYANIKENHDSSRPMPDLAILQMVATGKLRIEFSSAASKDIRELGLACVSIEPKDRPTAADALYRLHTVLSR